MSRLVAAPLAASSSLWSMMRGLTRAIASDARSNPATDIYTEHARIRLQSRHWLM